MIKVENFQSKTEYTSHKTVVTRYLQHIYQSINPNSLINNTIQLTHAIFLNQSYKLSIAHKN